MINKHNRTELCPWEINRTCVGCYKPVERRGEGEYRTYCSNECGILFRAEMRNRDGMAAKESRRDDQVVRKAEKPKEAWEKNTIVSKVGSI